MAKRKMQPGPTSERVQHNVREIRDGVRRMTLRQVSEGLHEIGHDLPVSALGKIETGHRRVDVDDLMALAIVLGVSPLRLMLPPVGHDGVRLTAEVSSSWELAWSWAAGEALPPTSAMLNERDAEDALKSFWAMNRPHKYRPRRLEDWSESQFGAMKRLQHATSEAIAAGLEDSAIDTTVQTEIARPLAARRADEESGKVLWGDSGPAGGGEAYAYDPDESAGA